MDRPTAIVTAASRGIGAACARALAERGYRLALMSTSAAVDVLAAELDAVAVHGSVASDADLGNLVHATWEAYGRIDAVVNNTGHAAKGPLLALHDTQWHEGLDLLMLNVARMARHVTPHMENQPSGGAFVNISSFAAVEPSPQFPISAVMRTALASYTKLYAQQYAPCGIRMNNLLPGFVDSYEVDEETMATIPAGRPARVEEIGAAAVWLISDEASYITGQNLRIDGGLTTALF